MQNVEGMEIYPPRRTYPDKKRKIFPKIIVWYLFLATGPVGESQIQHSTNNVDQNEHEKSSKEESTVHLYQNMPILQEFL